MTDERARNDELQRPKRTAMRLLIVLLFLLVVLLARGPCDPPPGDPAPACKPGEPCPVDAPAPPPEAGG
jgi:hypothetical protein